MKKVLNIGVILLFPSLLFSQQDRKSEFLNIEPSSIKKIILVDHYNDNYERVWGRVYEIYLSTDIYELFLVEEYYSSYQFEIDSISYSNMQFLEKHEIDSVSMVALLNETNLRNKSISKLKLKMDSIRWGTSEMLDNWKGKKLREVINKNQIDSLISQINAKTVFPKSYLFNIGIDSTWLDNNSDRLYGLWYTSNSETKYFTQTYVKYVLNNYNKFNELFWSSNLQRFTGSYPTFEVLLISHASDTISIVSEGQFHFQVPWDMNGKYKSYNPSLAIAIAGLLPDEMHFSSKSSLSPRWEEIESSMLEILAYNARFIDKKKWKKIARENKRNSR